VAQPPTPSKKEEKEARPRGSSRSKRGMTKPPPYSGLDRKSMYSHFRTHAFAMKGGIVT
jgi:hypothetical protein